MPHTQPQARAQSDIEGQTADLLAHVLQLGPGHPPLKASTELFGAIPEFDSMAVVAVITAIEENFAIVISDEDISAELFATVGSLARFVGKRTAQHTAEHATGHSPA